MKTTLLVSLLALVLLASGGLASAAPLQSAQPGVAPIAPTPAPPQLPAFLAVPIPPASVATGATAAVLSGETAITCPILPPTCGAYCHRLGCLVCCG